MIVIESDPFEEYIQAKIKLMMSQNYSDAKERAEFSNKEFRSMRAILNSGLDYRRHHPEN